MIDEILTLTTDIQVVAKNQNYSNWPNVAHSALYISQPAISARQDTG